MCGQWKDDKRPGCMYLWSKQVSLLLKIWSYFIISMNHFPQISKYQLIFENLVEHFWPYCVNCRRKGDPSLLRARNYDNSNSFPWFFLQRKTWTLSQHGGFLGRCQRSFIGIMAMKVKKEKLRSTESWKPGTIKANDWNWWED